MNSDYMVFIYLGPPKNLMSLSINETFKEVESLIRETIDTSMKDLLGEKGREATMFHVALSDYAKESKEFHVRLFSIFHQGSEVVEKMIVRDLYSRLNIPLKEGSRFDYEESIRYAAKVACDRIAPYWRGEYGR